MNRLVGHFVESIGGVMNTVGRLNKQFARGWGGVVGRVGGIDEWSVGQYETQVGLWADMRLKCETY